MNERVYQEQLMDHYRYPRNRGTLEQHDFAADDLNPSCGDHVAMTGCIEHDVITDVMFTGKGCVLSQASASMLTEICLGKKIYDVHAITPQDVCALVGITLGPTRMKCALLPLVVLQRGLTNYLATRERNNT